MKSGQMTSGKFASLQVYRGVRFGRLQLMIDTLRFKIRGSRFKVQVSRFTLHVSRLTVYCVLFTVYCFLLLPFTTLAQTVPTPTPDETGAIYVVVQPNDNLWNIAASAGITVEQLRALNNLDENDFIQPGQRLLIGYGTPPVTPTGSPTATLPPPTVTHTPPPPPRTAVCLVAFADVDRDGVHDLTEGLRTAVAFTIFTSQSVIANYITTGSEPYCLEGLAPGEYQVTRSIGRNETLTTDGDLTIAVQRGNVIHLEFGSFLVEEITVTETAVLFTPTFVSVGAVNLETAVPPVPTTTPERNDLPTVALLTCAAFGLTAVTVLFFLVRKTKIFR